MLVTVVIALQHRPMEFSLEAEDAESHLSPTLQIRKLQAPQDFAYLLMVTKSKIVALQP